ncbi:DVU0772 family protein [Megalodesulfovibrio paquesii]
MQLDAYKDCQINWELTPEEAVTLYLEWGNNNWHGKHAPVRSKNDVAHYFVVDTWGETPTIRLVRRSSEDAEDLACLPLPQEFTEGFREETGGHKGIYHPTEPIKNWLKGQLHH